MSLPSERLTSEAGMQDGETFSIRVDSDTVHVDDDVGIAEIGVRPGRSVIEALIDENNALRDEVARLTRLLNEPT